MGVSIMVSSHLLKEMEEVCDHLVVIHHGRKVLDSSSSELRRKHESVSIAVLGGPCEELKKLEGFLSEAPSPDNPASMLYKFSTIPAKTPELVKAAVGLGARIHGVSHEKLDLENIFIKLTSEGGLNVRADSF
jgi:ABC-2 type transport system ATP-binding protein